MFEMQSVLPGPVSSKRQLAAMAAFFHLSVASVLIVGTAWRIEAVDAPNLMEAFLPVAFLPAEWSETLARPEKPAVAEPIARAPEIVQPDVMPDAPPIAGPSLSDQPIEPIAAASGSASPAGGSAVGDIGGVGPGSGVAPAGAGAIVWQPGVGIVAPQVLYRIDPKYPEIARTARRQGAVVVEAEIATDGTLRSARVVSAPIGFGLEQSALDAVRAWRFAPARYGDRPVSVYYRWNIQFSLR